MAKNNNNLIWGVIVGIIIVALWGISKMECFQISNSTAQSSAFGAILSEVNVPHEKKTKGTTSLHTYDGDALNRALISHLIDQYNYTQPEVGKEYLVLRRLRAQIANDYSRSDLANMVNSYLVNSCEATGAGNLGTVIVHSPYSDSLSNANIVSHNNPSCKARHLCDLIALIKGYY